MEIERKFLIHMLPENLDRYPSHQIEQAYLCTDPVIRIRKEDDRYYLTCKGEGMLSREECNLPMPEKSYKALAAKAEGHPVIKRRYLIPLEGSLTAELDCFEDLFAGLAIAEVEFGSEEAAFAFTPPAWFGEEVTYEERYHNSWMSCHLPGDAS